MTVPRKPQSTPFRLVAASLTLATLIAGCGGTTPEVDTAETSRTEPAVKPTPTPEPTPTPPAEPGKDAPKG